MNIESVKEKLKEGAIFHSEGKILNRNSVIGYEKKFKWSWLATQLNTFIVVTDFGNEIIDLNLIETHISESFKFSKYNYKGWPIGLQSGLGVISILISNNVSNSAKDYCLKLEADKKWAGFSIPVIYNPTTKETFQFKKNPMWGRIYYPHFKKLINSLK